MHRVDAQISRHAVRLRPAPLADQNRRGTRWLVAGVAFPVGCGIAQPVQVRHRDPRHPLIGNLMVFAVLPLQDVPSRWSAQVPVRLVDVGQQFHIGRRVKGGELGTLIDRRFHLAGLAIGRDQSRLLCPAQTRQPGDVAPHQALARPVQAGILVPHQRLLHPTVHLLSPLPGKPHLATAGQERPHLLQAPRF